MLSTTFINAKNATQALVKMRAINSAQEKFNALQQKNALFLTTENINHLLEYAKTLDGSQANTFTTSIETLISISKYKLDQYTLKKLIQNIEARINHKNKNPEKLLEYIYAITDLINITQVNKIEFSNILDHINRISEKLDHANLAMAISETNRLLKAYKDLISTENLQAILSIFGKFKIAENIQKFSKCINTFLQNQKFSPMIIEDALFIFLEKLSEKIYQSKQDYWYIEYKEANKYWVWVRNLEIKTKDDFFLAIIDLLQNSLNSFPDTSAHKHHQQILNTRSKKMRATLNAASNLIASDTDTKATLHVICQALHTFKDTRVKYFHDDLNSRYKTTDKNLKTFINTVRDANLELRITYDLLKYFKNEVYLENRRKLPHAFYDLLHLYNAAQVEQPRNQEKINAILMIIEGALTACKELRSSTRIAANQKTLENINGYLTTVNNVLLNFNDPSKLIELKIAADHAATLSDHYQFLSKGMSALYTAAIVTLFISTAILYTALSASLFGIVFIALIHNNISSAFSLLIHKKNRMNKVCNNLPNNLGKLAQGIDNLNLVKDKNYINTRTPLTFWQKTCVLFKEPKDEMYVYKPIPALSKP